MPDSPSERTLIQRPAAAALRVPAAHALLLRHEGTVPRRIPLDDRPVRIGRGTQNELVLPSPDVSRQHCRVALVGGQAVVTDLESTNGVYVDGVRLAGEARLMPGARVVVGPYTLRYQRGTVEELARAEALEHEQARAVAYIQAMLPPPLHDGPVHADWRFAPSAQIGGDVFGYRWLEDGCFAMYLLDVSGHGVGSALLAASAANALRAPNMAAANPSEPASVLTWLNAAFQSEDHDGLFFTAWYGVYNPASRTLRFSSAGHHPAFLATNAGAGLQPLSTRAPAIGMAPAPRFRLGEAPAPPGSRLYLFSDGAFETKMPDGRDGRIEDMLPLIGQPPVPDQPEPDRLFEAVRNMTGRRPFEDDVSLLTMAFH